MNKNDLIKPSGNDYISQGDDAITRNAEVLEQLWDDHQFIASRAYKVIPFQEFPGTDIQKWYGFENEGIYRIPSYTVLNGLTGYPHGAGPGTLSILAIGSAASRVEWVEMGEMGRTWVGTISSSAAYHDDWHLVQTAKRVATSLTCGRATDRRVATNVGHALPFTVAAHVYRWRLHFRNTNDRTTQTIGGSLSINSIGVGHMQRDDAGDASPNIVPGTYTQIDGPVTTPSSGGEYITPWIETLPLEANKDYVFRYGFTAAPDQEVNYLEGGGWILNDGTSAVATDTPAATITNRSPLDVWIELEVDANVPNWAYFGDSLTVGQGATLPVYDSWAAKHARSRGAIPTFFAHAGSRMSEWTNPAHIKFRKYQLPAYRITRPTVLYWAMGSNDLFAETKSVQDMLTQMHETFPLITDVSSNNVVMTTVLPRHDGTDPQEAVRKEWNDHIQTHLPHGTLTVFDAAEALTDSSGDEIDPKWTTSDTDIHLSTAGYARFATQVAT